MTGDGCVPKGRAWQSVMLVRPVDSNGNVMNVGDMIGHGDVIGEIEHFVACPVIRSGCNQIVVSNALDWDIVPKDICGEIERDVCRLVMGDVRWLQERIEEGEY